MSACGGCEGREKVNAWRDAGGETRVCPAMLAEVPPEDCGKKIFGKCATCVSAKKGAEPISAPFPEKGCGAVVCAKCGAAAVSKKYGARPALCARCLDRWKKDGSKAGKTRRGGAVAKPVPALEPAVATRIAPGPRLQGAVTLAEEGDARSMTQQMMGLTGRFLDVIGNPDFPLDSQVNILCDLSEGVKNLSKVALIRAEASLK